MWMRIVLAFLLTFVACTSGGDDERAELERSVRAYSTAFLTGDADGTHALLSSRCRERVPLAQFRAVVTAAAAWYIGVTMTSFSVDQLSGNLARVTYRFNNAALDQEREPWTKEDGRWRQDDC